MPLLFLARGGGGPCCFFLFFLWGPACVVKPPGFALSKKGPSVSFCGTGLKGNLLLGYSCWDWLKGNPFFGAILFAASLGGTEGTPSPPPPLPWFPSKQPKGYHLKSVHYEWSQSISSRLVDETP